MLTGMNDQDCRLAADDGPRPSFAISSTNPPTLGNQQSKSTGRPILMFQSKTSFGHDRQALAPCRELSDQLAGTLAPSCNIDYERHELEELRKLVRDLQIFSPNSSLAAIAEAKIRRLWRASTGLKSSSD
jgi:hypothetical protein